METELTRSDIDLLLESLEYSKMNLIHAKDSSWELRQEKLRHIEAVMATIRSLRDGKFKLLILAEGKK